MKILSVLLLAGVVIGGAYYFTSDRAAAPTTPPPANEPTESESAVTEDDESPDSDAETTADHVFELTGTNFAFSATALEVTEGDTVTIVLNSEEGVHDWVLDEFDAATEVISPGETTSVTFVADEQGTFEYYCSVGNHRAQGMVGTLTVRPNTE